MKTPSSFSNQPFFRPGVLAVCAVALLASAVVLWETARQARMYALDEIRAQSRYTLDLVVENLRGELAKYSFQPRLLANSHVLVDALKRQEGEVNPDAANAALERANEVTGASATYLMDRNGLTIAASNWSSDRPFVGRNFDFRPYFKEAIQGRLGRFFALGTTSGERGYYFAFPVRVEGEIAGVVVVKMDVAKLEAGWRSQGSEILVIDDEGIVFLSNRPEWRLRASSPLDVQARERLRLSRRYDDAPLRRLPLTKEGHRDLVTVGWDDENAGGKASERRTAGRQYLAMTSDMKEAGWRVMILADASDIGRRVQIALMVVGFMLASAILAGLNIYQRRRRLNERLELQEAAKGELEAKVEERTDELTRAVTQLQAEVAERLRAEEELRQTQQELIQASKLSALGRLSAGLSHELNQPLSAIRSYAENARKFLVRNETKTADANLGSIAELSDRMARIIRNLRTYARNEPVGSRPTPLARTIKDAVALLDTEIRAAGVDIDLDLGDEDLRVVGGDVRLQQVFVNLISNAIDAIKVSDTRRVSVQVRACDASVDVLVADTGPGISGGDIGRVFDPFFTTKDVGQGTGLGLSIAYGIVENFGGSIGVENSPSGGAVFTVSLKRDIEAREAAE